MRTRRRGRWLPKQPRLGARMCQGTFFFFHRIGNFVSIREDALCGNLSLRDPPRRRIPAEQDSIVVLSGSDRFQQERVGDAWDALPLVVARFGKQRAGGDE